MPESRACPNCHIGVMRPAYSTFVQWLGGGRALVAPDQMAWTCDVCKETIYDDRALIRIGLVLGHQMKRGKSPAGGPPRGDAGGNAPGSNPKQRSVK